MVKRLSQSSIEAACACLLAQQRRVGVRQVMVYLRTQYGIAGRTERVAQILRSVESGAAVSIGPPASEELLELRERVVASEARAARAEELERRHQDFWAARYDEKVQEVEARSAALLARKVAVMSEQYLKVCQQAADLARRLQLYETVEPQSK